MKPFLLFCYAAVILSACGTTSATPTVTITPGMITSPTTRTPTPTITSTPTTILITMQPVDAYIGWITLETSYFTLEYPPSYYNPTSPGPVLYIADTKTTYDSWMHTDSIADNGLLFQLISLNLDRRLDPYNDPSLLATPEQALQREINRAIGIAYYVSGSINVPWENANGGTDDGRKAFQPNVPYQNVMLGNTNTARVVGENTIYYFILNPNDNSYYVRISIQPTSSSLIQVADQILSSFTFSH